MAPEILIFMPNGDVTLKLMRHVVSEPTAQITKNHPSTAEEPLDEDAEIEAALGIEPETPADEENLVFYAPDAPGADDGPFYPPTPRARGSDASRRDRSPSPPASFWAALKRQAEQVNGTGDAVEDETASAVGQEEEAEKIVVASHEVQAICSSRHLMLASRYFERILSGEFKEARALRATGHVQIEFVEEDLESMVILLNIVHGASRKVPRTVSLEGLGTLAVLVSKFAMLESVDFFSDTWIDHLKREGLPKSYNRDVLRLLYVFWVFDREKEFRDMTRLAQRESDEGFDEDVKGLAIPCGIVEAIKTVRQSAIASAMSIVDVLITKYMDGSDQCDAALDDELRYACDAMVLGSLLKSSRKIGIWPKPQAPFPGRKWRDVAKNIRGIRVLDVCNKTSSRKWNSHGPSGNAHGIEDEIESALKDVEKSLNGLKLKDFAKQTDDYVPVYVPEPEIEAPVASAQEAQEPPAHSNGSLNSNTNGNQDPSPETQALRGQLQDADPHRVSRAHTVPRAEPEEYHQTHEFSVASIPMAAVNNGLFMTPSPAPPYPDLEVEDPRQQTSQAAQQIRGRGPPQAIIREETSPPETNQAEEQAALLWSSGDSRDHPAPERESSRSQHSSGYVQRGPLARNSSPEASAHEVSTRKPGPSAAAPQNHYQNGNSASSASTATTPAHVPVRATDVPGPVAATNGFSQQSQAKLSPRKVIQEAAFPKPNPVPPPHQDAGPNCSISTSSTPSPKYGLSSPSYFSQPIIHQDVQRQSQSPPRHSRHDVSSAKPTPVSPPSQNNTYNHHNIQGSHSVQTSNPTKRANAINTPLPPSPQEEHQLSAPVHREATRREPGQREPTQRDVPKTAVSEKKLVRTPSHPQISLVREDVKSPTPSQGRILSLDDAALGKIHSRNSNSSSTPSTRTVYKNNGHTPSNQEDRNTTLDNYNSNSNPASAFGSTNNGHGQVYQEERRSTSNKTSDRKAPNGATHNTNDRKAAIGERKSPSPPAIAMAAVNKGREAREVAGGRESPLKQVQSAENGREGNESEVLDIEELDAWVPPAQNFRVRKGKKVFTNRFS